MPSCSARSRCALLTPGAPKPAPRSQPPTRAGRLPSASRTTSRSPVPARETRPAGAARSAPAGSLRGFAPGAALWRVGGRCEHMNMPALASSPRMVGRRAELDSLLQAYAEGRAGTPRTVVVRGEAGIGKTRLVQEFLAAVDREQSRELPVVVTIGPCVDLGPI